MKLDRLPSRLARTGVGVGCLHSEASYDTIGGILERCRAVGRELRRLALRGPVRLGLGLLERLLGLPEQLAAFFAGLIAACADQVLGLGEFRDHIPRDDLIGTGGAGLDRGQRAACSRAGKWS